MPSAALSHPTSSLGSLPVRGSAEGIEVGHPNTVVVRAALVWAIEREQPGCPAHQLLRAALVLVDQAGETKDRYTESSASRWKSLSSGASRIASTIVHGTRSAGTGR